MSLTAIFLDLAKIDFLWYMLTGEDTVSKIKGCLLSTKSLVRHRDTLERVQGGTMRMIKDLKNLACQEKLRDSFKVNLTTLNKSLMEGCKDEPGSFQWCPLTGQEAMVRLEHRR